MCRTRNASNASFLVAAAGAALLLLQAAPAARAQQVNDPAGDFLPTYAGPRNGDLDVLSADVVFNGTDFFFSSMLNGAVGATPGAFYVFGVDRGAGTARFGALAPSVLFDSVVVIRPGGVSNVNDLVPSVTSLVLPDANITISGNRLSARVPVAMLPSEGRPFEQYTFNLWPRFPVANGTNATQISDFAPDNSNARVTVIPEPGTLILLGTGIAALAGGARRRRREAPMAA
jgi:hypothetical protein